MIRLLQQTSLKTVVGIDEVYRIENIDSILVPRIKNFLISMHNNTVRPYFSASKRYHECEKIDVISFFRGFIPNFEGDLFDEEQYRILIAEYSKNFFVVGEKGNAYRENVNVDGIDPYYRNNPTANDIKEILELVNSILNRNGFGYIDLDKILRYANDDITGTYMFLLNLAHNIGGQWENKCRSPFVSAAYGNRGFKKAFQFANNRNNNDHSYILWGFQHEDVKDRYIFTKELCQTLGMMDVNWYEDIHHEIIIKDGIFPQNILGVFVIENQTGRKNFIINPYLYQLFDAGIENARYNSSELIIKISRYGIPIDQIDFDRCAKELGYKSYGYDIDDGYIRAGKIGNYANLILPRNTRL
ncbi:hypothetical protein [Enterococcus pallens]|uniref:Uncharacterized protein n=1 Tax=Enterococcus pallens ATCC BAA-351 TaxID=1158607 RepID=R2QG67_9ENTE|nr:hypothetical protein [Enterococcus pallens]EOH94233.1 hypothetical protein UAU_01968 [Enterococcus pallens ATCC BAA-351]EOU24112.1 hypothetical protein I588_00099 [Enterococcus pallens ATCC BAA-351]OJG82115.1 hypothetical protein RV10_GL001979 [Enterococcus pallens]